MPRNVHPIRPKDIHSLTHFQRKTKEHVERLQRTGRPEVLTVNGKAALVVQDADAYQRLLDVAERMDTLLAVRGSLDSMKRGEGVSLDELDREMREKHGLPARRSANPGELEP